MSAQVTDVTPPLAAPRGLGARIGGALAARIARLRTNAGVLSVLDQAVVSGASFAVSVLIGRLCSREDLGKYALAVSVIYLVRLVQEQLVSAPYVIYSPRKQGVALARFTGSCLVHQLLMTAGAMLLAVLLHGALTVAGRGIDSATLLFLLFAGPWMLLREHVRYTNFGLRRFGSALALDGLVCAVQLAGLAALAASGMLSVTTAAAVIAVACSVAIAVWFRSGVARLAFDRQGIVGDWRSNWSFGRWALASQLLGATTPYLMPWLIAVTHGESATGLLAASTTLVGLASMFVQGLANYATPRTSEAYAHGGTAALRQVLLRLSLLFAGLNVAFCGGVWLTGDLALRLVYGGEYAGGGMLLLVLAGTLLVNSQGIVIGNGLWAVEKPRANFLADVCGLSTTFVAAVCLVLPWGALGAACALLAGALVGTAVRGLTLFRLLGSSAAANGSRERPGAGEQPG